MSEWIEWLRQYAFEAGTGGLLLLSGIDSAGVPTGAGPDVVLALLAALRPAAGFGLVAAASAGSVLGCLILYGIGRRGGQAAARRFEARVIKDALDALRRRGVLAVFLSMLAPPPIPTKAFVLGAGLAGMPLLPFLLATLVGRLLRYGLVAALASRFGPGILDGIRAGSLRVLAVLAIPGLVTVGLLLLRRHRSRRS